LPEDRSAQVIVVGAGIAGLTAAHCLAKAGIRVKVLEAAGRVGGRMITDVVNGFPVDGGAQFLSSEYPLLSSLAREVGLHANLRATSDWNAIVRRGKICRIRSDSPLRALTSGLLGPSSWMRLGWQVWRLRSWLKQLPLNDYSQWSGFDLEPVASWAKRRVGPSAVEYFFEPMLHGFYFQEPEETSAVLGLVMLGFGLRGARTLALLGGMGTLPEQIAARLAVSLNSRVRSVERSTDSVVVTTDTSRMEAEYAILATPASEAKRLYLTDDDVATRLMAVSYSASICIAIVTGSGFRLPLALREVYGLLIPRRERRHIAAICIEGNKNRACAPGGQLLNILLCHASATAMMALPDDEVVTFALKEADEYLPGLSTRIATARLYRWRQAEPLSHVGRARDIAQYRQDERSLQRRVWLAGDYMSMPFTEGAAEAGKWAAGEICKRVREE
jgi:oxygen-dependent protoporphyrinogen oxidase